jgi:dipeptidyl-peptidase-4
VPTETFATASATAEYGFLLVSLSSRAAPGMGKKMLDSIYLKLGQTEMDDMAEGIKSLWNRPYFDKGRVGIYGTSYGGYTAAMEIVRHPEVFTAASASSPVTAWYHYDTIYTERYMWIPQENKDGYEKGSAMSYAERSAGPAAPLLRHRGQQRAPEQLHAVDSRAATGRQELRSAGRARRRPQRRE